MGVLANPEKAQGQVVEHRGHPGDMEYLKIFVILAVITTVEVALFYIDMDRKLLIPSLIVLSAVKFIMVVSWFMHLKFDSRLFTTAFVTGLLLAAAVFTVVLATLGSNLV
ncbi:MAG: cytochrome C oxidase subunit IV family protein [Chloroflexi bacterium]|nr:cytochrome C oxidase subunit IV family protein [Chloroflexota bacterium]